MKPWGITITRNWVPTAHRLPTERVRVLIYPVDGDVDLGWWEDGLWFGDGDNIVAGVVGITHWMLLPSRPPARLAQGRDRIDIPKGAHTRYSPSGDAQLWVWLAGDGFRWAARTDKGTVGGKYATATEGEAHTKARAHLLQYEGLDIETWR